MRKQTLTVIQPITYQRDAADRGQLFSFYVEWLGFFVGWLKHFIGRLHRLIGRLVRVIGCLGRVIGRLERIIGCLSLLIGRLDRFIGRLALNLSDSNKKPSSNQSQANLLLSKQCDDKNQN
ncbi:MULTISPECIES: hypothetical protein [Allobacillus]|uniref:Uncharacterized protein n=1 Tax=Allobacillus salarius TaxID=1955272 RepID=A0A556PGH4_9BACI|nr:hypothetical protein [Allobacillus salarius]TSJ63500.1 hypothetical protein FPQ13_09195 [Allobacillus salarius]